MQVLKFCGIILIPFALGCGEVRSNSGDGGTDDASSLDASSLDAAAIDANGSDGGNTCPPGKICDPNVNFAFVSSTTVTPGELGGLENADTLCNSLAGKAELTGNYVAWLSGETEDASARLGIGNGWVRPDRTPFALSKKDLENARIIHPLNLDENGEELTDFGLVVTGTMANGQTTGDTCQNWGDTSAGMVANYGIATSVGDEWTESRDRPCSNDIMHIYCLGTDHNNPLTKPSATGRKAWVSSASVSADIGVTGMDSVCEAEAAAAGAGDSLAFVATLDSSAAGRFDLNGPTWVRLDGVILWDQASELGTKGPLAPVLLDSTSTEIVGDVVWTGSEDANTVATSDGLSNCVDWSIRTGGRTNLGYAVRNGSDFFNGLRPQCTFSRRVFCFER